MIQIRKTDGSALRVEDGAFVELVNETDGTIMLAFAQIEPGVILQISPGSKDAGRYQQMFAHLGLKFATQVIERS